MRWFDVSSGSMLESLSPHVRLGVGFQKPTGLYSVRVTLVNPRGWSGSYFFAAVK
jgi:hypothetical protein